MVKLDTLQTVAVLEQEMARTGRTAEEKALREVLSALGRPERGFLTTGQAASRLGVTIPTIKRWVGRGTLSGGIIGGRWLVSVESVDKILGLREALGELDSEGNPTIDEIHALYARRRVPSDNRES